MGENSEELGGKKEERRIWRGLTGDKKKKQQKSGKNKKNIFINQKKFLI